MDDDNFIHIPTELDWQDAANCQVESVEDTSFIREPDEVTRKRWERICSKCQVIEECFTWANRHDVSGVFIAGEWRDNDDEGI